MRPPFEVAHIITRFKDSFFKKQIVCEQVRKVFSQLEDCRTRVLGGHVDACPQCGVTRVSYNSCRNRHCPKCQGAEREIWIDNRKEELLPVKYFHVVFTLPSALHSLCLGNMKIAYNSLFGAAWDTIRKFAANMGVKQTAMIAILHTWGSNLHYHPHLHCIVPSGGIDKYDKWKSMSCSSQKGSYLFPVKGMSRMFRAKFMAMVRKKLEIPQELGKKLFKQEWVVYSKPPFAGVEKVLEYAGRYSHRVAISNQRIKNITDTHVCFDYKDYRQGGKHKLLTLTGEDFLQRFSLHILPKGFVRIRHFGFMAPCNRKKIIELQLQMNVPCICTTTKRKKKKWSEIYPQKWEEYNLCKECGQGQMITVEVFLPSRPPPMYNPKRYDIPTT